MTAAPAPKPYVSYADFVALEEKSTTKHEWLDGVVYDMSGGTITHARLIASVILRLGVQLEERRCTLYSSELAVRIQATGLLTYPDVSVVCGPPETDPANKNAVTNPRVIVEVLSDATETYDRGQKFAHYQRIPSLAEYVLVSQSEPCIEVLRRKIDGDWDVAEKYLAGQTVELASIECSLAVDKVYGNTLRVA